MTSKQPWPNFAQSVAAATEALSRKIWDLGLVTPLVVDEPLGPRAIGSGSYIYTNDMVYTLTAAHVANEGRDGNIIHLPVSDEDFHLLGGPFMAEALPMDVAIARGAGRNAIRSAMFDEVCEPIEDEILLLVGYPATTAIRSGPVLKKHVRTEVFGTFHTPAIRYATQALKPQPPARDVFDPKCHIAIHYPDGALVDSGDVVRDLPHPGGLSGSLLWDSKLVYANSVGAEWVPEMARVCGLVHHDFGSFLFATRVEYLRSTILELVRHERAYLRWKDSGEPHGHALSDWLWAEKTISVL